VDGLEVASPGPVLVFMQHASMPDTLLPTNFITRRFGIQLRFVVKRELLVDPCLDIAGHWLPNYFVDRGATDPAQEVARIKALADELGPSDGVLIYPEGTRFTREKQGRAIAKLREGDPAIFALAERLRHVLPPRLGGPLALLDGDAQADVVFVAHHGFGGFGSMSRIWRGAMVRRTIRMAFWRVPRAEIPAEPDARVRWLYDHWHRMDAWMAEREGEGEA
jgi:1-acyl-sn-glycerol-3-phosphate acyltransferase